MILCVDSRAVEEAPKIQKDIDLEDLLNNHTKYFNSEEEAYKENYEPLSFSVSIRSMYSNLVLETDKVMHKYYTTISVEQPFNHRGYDLIMFLTSICVMKNIDYALGFDDVMMKHSQFQPIGVSKVGSPIIYTHVILSDEGVEEFEKFLKPDRRFVPIKFIDRRGAYTSLIDTLIEVKEENK